MQDGSAYKHKPSSRNIGWTNKLSTRRTVCNIASNTPCLAGHLHRVQQLPTHRTVPPFAGSKDGRRNGMDEHICRDLTSSKGYLACSIFFFGIRWSPVVLQNGIDQLADRHSRGSDARSWRHELLRFAVAAPHDTCRLARRHGWRYGWSIARRPDWPDVIGLKCTRSVPRGICHSFDLTLNHLQLLGLMFNHL